VNTNASPPTGVTPKVVMSIYEEIQNLETERLILRRFTPFDAKEILSLKLIDGDKIHRIDRITTEAEAEAFVDKKSNFLENKKGIAWAITSKGGGNCLGSIELTRLADEDKSHIREIGFYVGIPYRGNGYASEAIKHVTASAFAIHEELQRIHAEVHPGNEASIRTLESCGFSQEGILRSWNMGEVNGCWLPVDLVVLALTRNQLTIRSRAQGYV
jgi:[ribosomal protein S5]-alanine N-acetyltransferase